MIELTRETLRAVFPRAPEAVIEAFVTKQGVLTKVGVNATRTRLSYFFANLEHECGGFALKGLEESLAYTPERMAQVWPNRFASAAAVRARFGTAPGWQLQAFDEIYGNRMGNRPGSHDGSTYIGRGGPQWTGRDGYKACQARTGVPAVDQPKAVSQLDLQPEICAAFWDWKGLNAKADAGDFKGCVKLWNGGSNGLADRLHLMAGNDPIIARMASVDRILPVAKAMPGAPPSAKPPKAIVNAATTKERRLRNAAAATGAAGAGNEGAKQGSSVHVPLPHAASIAVIGLALGVALVATILLARKRAAVVANWF
ncbi:MULTISPECIES: glycosyl hydrolase [unclassified Bradyrhizobium]|uniref:glycoside hydrolase family 19 protein n=1 Tax=unclassified Bradyrhizobium TaxID=2631580 RepID=UPI0028E5B8C0|nr:MULTISPECIES: glycosyl hydrolase [unclassified Bradyrhizobium]